jgi:uncharacterized protein YcfJ
MVLDPGEMMRKVNELELQQQYKSDNDPEKPPPKEHGDKYYAAGALVGAIFGGITGGVLSRFGGLMLFDIIGGGVVGGFIGIFIGSQIRKNVLKKTQ